MANQVSVKFIATKNELVFQIVRQATSSWIFRIVVAVLLARLAWEVISSAITGKLTDAVLYIAIMFPLLVFPLVLVRIRLIGKNFDEQTWCFSDEGASVASVHGSSTWSWKHFDHDDADPWFYYLYYSKNNCVFIPKRAFETPEQDAAFKKLVASRMKTTLK